MTSRISEVERAIDEIDKLYFFLFSDAFRELREAEVRWECYSASQFHFDDGVKFILEGAGETFPVDDPVWTAYSEKITEIEGRVARAEERKRERLAALKGVHAGFVRFCAEIGLDPRRVVEAQPLGGEATAALERDDDVLAAEPVVAETCRLLHEAWDRVLGATAQAA